MGPNRKEVVRKIVNAEETSYTNNLTTLSEGCQENGRMFSNLQHHFCHSEQSACPEYALSFAKGLSKEGICFSLLSSLYVFSHSLTILDVSFCHSRHF